MDSKLRHSTEKPDDAHSLSALTKREREVLGWISEGKRDAEIAVLLRISVRTINKHVQSILCKLKAETRTTAARYALEARYLAGSPPDETDQKMRLARSQQTATRQNQFSP